MKKRTLTGSVLACIAVLSMLAGCSKNDDPSLEDNPGEGKYFSPKSIIDDTRISVMKGFLRPTLQINYLKNGAPAYALYESTDFRFSYKVQSGKLILSEIKHSGSINTFTVGDIAINADGFVTAMTETNVAKTTSGEYAGKETVTTIKSTFEYDDHGRVKSRHTDVDKITAAGYHTRYDWNATTDYDGMGRIKSYNTRGNGLVHNVVFSYKEGRDEPNKYNIYVPEFVEGAADKSPATLLFAMTGMLGNASTYFPQNITVTDRDYNGTTKYERVYICASLIDQTTGRCKNFLTGYNQGSTFVMPQYDFYYAGGK